MRAFVGASGCGGYAHTKQSKRLCHTVKRQRTILGVVMREVRRKPNADKAAVAAGGAPAQGAANEAIDAQRRGGSAH